MCKMNLESASESKGSHSQEITFLRRLVIDLKDNPNEFQLEAFFAIALLGPGEPYRGEDPIYGKILFRLSDLIVQDKRRGMKVFPSEHGSLNDDGIRWMSLEEWRKVYQEMYPDIPTLSELWPEGSRFLPLLQNPST